MRSSFMAMVLAVNELASNDLDFSTNKPPGLRAAAYASM